LNPLTYSHFIFDQIYITTHTARLKHQPYTLYVYSFFLNWLSRMKKKRKKKNRLYYITCLENHPTCSVFFDINPTGWASRYKTIEGIDTITTSLESAFHGLICFLYRNLPKPRAATSVATRIFAWPDRNWFNVWSRSFWDLLPCIPMDLHLEFSC